MKNKTDGINRRGFLKAAGVALSLSTAKGVAKEGANERVNCAVIGVGGMGFNGHVKNLLKLRGEGLVNIVAVCDVWDKRVQRAVQECGTSGVKDYRRVLDNKDVDVVSIVTPDHWHAQMAVEAAAAGKDIYCEKPMTHWKNLEDTKAVVRAVEKYKRVLQVGTHGMTSSMFILAEDKMGLIGKPVQAQAGDMRNGYCDLFDIKRNDPDAVPGKNLDWDMWLGPAPKIPYNPGRYFAFRLFWDYSGGLCTDLFPHMLTPFIRLLDLKYPKRVSASGGIYCYKDGREVPDTFSALLEYEDGPQILLSSTMANDNSILWLIRGHEGTISFPREGTLTIEFQKADGKEAKPPIHIPQQQASSPAEHYKDLFNSLRTRKKPRSNELLGLYVVTTLNMAVRSFLEKRVFTYDAEKQEVRPA